LANRVMARPKRSIYLRDDQQVKLKESVGA
jgi:hypothetical protein